MDMSYFTSTQADMQPSPVSQEEMENPADELFSHILLESIGLGGLGMVLMGMKMKGNLQSLNLGASVNIKPTLKPEKMFKPV